MSTIAKSYHIPVYKVQLVRESSVQHEQRQVRSSAEVASLLRLYLDGADREHFVVLLLDTKNKVIGINTVSTGSLSASVVHPREVFKPAIVSNAYAVLCGHNHPSGAPRSTDVERIQ